MPLSTLNPRRFLTYGLIVGGGVVILEISALLLRRRVMRVRRGGVPVKILDMECTPEGSLAILSSSALTDHPGTLVLWNQDRSKCTTLGPVISSGPEGTKRTVLGVLPAGMAAGSDGFLYGHVGSTPTDMSLSFDEVQLGSGPAWIVHPDEPAEANATWVVHVHGLGGGRNQTLRGLSVFSRGGFTSLVPSLDISLDHGDSHSHAGSFGVGEVDVLVSAHDYAITHGAARVIFVGWSYGALAVVRTMSQMKWADVAGLVLVSPALDWNGIIRNALGRAAVPPIVQKLVLSRFNSFWSRGRAARDVWAGIDRDVATVLSHWPTLITHGGSDSLVPVSQSEALSQRFNESVIAHIFPKAHHGMEWNSSIKVWESSVREWIEAL